MTRLWRSSRWKIASRNALAVAFVMCGLLAQTNSAKADTIGSMVYYSVEIGNGPFSSWLPVPITLNQMNSQTETFGGNLPVGGNVSISASISSTFAPSSILSTSQSNITNNTGGSITVDLLFVSSPPFTVPSGGGVVSMVNFSGTASSNASNISVTSYVENGVVTGQAVGGTALPNLLNPSNANLDGSGPLGSGPLGSLGAFGVVTKTGPVSTLGAIYTIGQEFQVTLAANGNINSTASTALTNPEPASMALFGIGFLGMAGLGWRRRRGQTAV
jgi:PEP-CTERM motif